MPYKTINPVKSLWTPRLECLPTLLPLCSGLLIRSFAEFLCDDKSGGHGPPFLRLAKRYKICNFAYYSINSQVRVFGYGLQSFAVSTGTSVGSQPVKQILSNAVKLKHISAWKNVLVLHSINDKLIRYYLTNLKREGTALDCNEIFGPGA